MSPKLWLYLIGGVVLSAALAGAAFTVNHWRNEAAKVPVLKQEIRDHEATIEQIRANIVTANNASQAYQDEIARLRERRTVSPAPVVRVCRPARQATVPVPGTESGPDEAAPAGGVLPPEVGSDIGPELYGLMDEADELSAQIRGLQKFINDLINKYVP